MNKGGGVDNVCMYSVMEMLKEGGFRGKRKYKCSHVHGIIYQILMTTINFLLGYYESLSVNMYQKI